jgi:hypothetical protein
MLARLGESVAEKTGESLLEKFAEVVAKLAEDLLSFLLGGVAAALCWASPRIFWRAAGSGAAG